MAVHDTEDCPRRNNSVHLNSVQRVCDVCLPKSGAYGMYWMRTCIKLWWSCLFNWSKRDKFWRHQTFSEREMVLVWNTGSKTRANSFCCYNWLRKERGAKSIIDPIVAWKGHPKYSPNKIDYENYYGFEKDLTKKNTKHEN